MLQRFEIERGRIVFLSAVGLAVVFTLAILLGGFGQSTELINFGIYGMGAMFAVAIAIGLILVIWRFVLEGTFNWVKSAWSKTPAHIQLTLVMSVLITVLVLFGLASMLK